jgi:hypothetical protein
LVDIKFSQLMSLKKLLGIKMMQDSKQSNRLGTYGAVSTELALLSNQRLLTLLESATPLGTSIGGTTALLEVAGSTIFVKKVRGLTDIERRPENIMSTANLFVLPTFCQYGLSGIGSPGFGVWRELATHVMTTNWVLSGQCPNFPLMYHWRLLPRPLPCSPTEEQLDQVEREVAYWGGSSAVRSRLLANLETSAEIVLFLERFPENLDLWLHKQFAKGDDAIESACAMVESKLHPIISFINSRGLLHFDAHFQNILTDGDTLYFADFGLALCEDFELSKTECDFFKRHHNYDRCYTMAHWAKWLLYELFGADSYEAILHKCAAGNGSETMLPSVARIILRYAPIAVVMSDFFRKIKTENKKELYPVSQLESLCAFADLLPATAQ